MHKTGYLTGMKMKDYATFPLLLHQSKKNKQSQLRTIEFLIKLNPTAIHSYLFDDILKTTLSLDTEYLSKYSQSSEDKQLPGLL